MTVTSPSPVAAGAAARELAAYEGLRAGRYDAFTSLATELDPILGDLALASTGDAGAARLLVRHAWTVALPGLDLFAWRCSLRAWIAGVLVGLAHPVEGPDVGGWQHARRHAGARAEPPVAGGKAARGGPHDWSDLPWAVRWGEAAWHALEQERGRLPVLGRQVVVLADVHGWPPGDAADAVGLTALGFTRELGAARALLHDALERVTGAAALRCEHDRVALLGGLAVPSGAAAGTAGGCAACATLTRRWQPVATLLASTAAHPPARPDPELLALFRRWRAMRRRGLAGWLARRMPAPG